MQLGTNQQGFLPSTDKAGRFRLLRTGSTLYYLWAPGTQGNDFQLLDEFDIGTNDVKSVYLNVSTNNQTRNEARVNRC